MKNYICWENENGFECYNEIEIVEVYEKEILKSEYPTFDGWLDDMLKMGILIESERKEEMVQIKIRGGRDHYSVYADDKFFCTCDTLREVDEELVAFDKFEIV
jgi:hypothetical protein